MRLFITACLLLVFLSVRSQSRADTLKLLRNTVKLYDLDFTESEADSMMEDVYGNLALYKQMHATLPKNDIPFPFAFSPLPFGETIPSKQNNIKWHLPKMQRPANLNELSFYTVTQLASLIKNKQISSVELTKFFINRLKTWGDTLEAVITLTEDLAMKQAAQADDEIKRGIYRGPLSTLR